MKYVKINHFIHETIKINKILDHIKSIRGFLPLRLLTPTVRFISLFAPSKNTKITQKSIEKPMEY